ncbi:MAG: DNA repair protein [Marinomonas sp.]|nr:DNA repair protein [Marinomonas sp.]
MVVKTMGAVLLMSLAGCQTAYYGAMEKIGIDKRDILVDRVEDVRDSQKDSQEEFQTAYQRLVVLTDFDGGDYEDIYNDLNGDYQNSKAAAERVSKKIDNVEEVANDLFDEWEDELDQYTNSKLRRASEDKLNATKRQFSQMLRSMHQAESKMAPVLATLNDNVLYLKHNLNAAAVSAIKGEFASLRTDISGLINEMSEAIKESDDFIATLQQ